MYSKFQFLDGRRYDISTYGGLRLNNVEVRSSDVEYVYLEDPRVCVPRDQMQHVTLRYV
jgi:hypothetical protein